MAIKAKEAWQSDDCTIIAVTLPGGGWEYYVSAKAVVNGSALEDIPAVIRRISQTNLEIVHVKTKEQ